MCVFNINFPNSHREKVESLQRQVLISCVSSVIEVCPTKNYNKRTGIDPLSCTRRYFDRCQILAY